MGLFTPKTKDMTMTWGKRLILVVIIMGTIFYGILSLAERNKDSLRKGIEDYLVEATGHPAEITDMVTVELTPNIVFRMNGINVRDKDDSGKVLVHADKAYISMPLWKMLLGQRDYIGFEIQNLEMAGGFYLPKKLTANFVGISDPSPEKSSPAIMMVEGTYNDHPILITGDLKRKSSKKYYLYSFPDNFPFTFKIGALEADGLFVRGFNDVSLKQVQLTREDQRAEFVLRDIHFDPLNATSEGTINDNPFKATLKKFGENTVLTILPGPGADIGEIKALIDNIKEDIGLAEDDAFRIEITPLAGESSQN